MDLRGIGRAALLIAAAVLGAVGWSGCLKKPGQESVSVTYDTLIDARDGKKYKTVKIGRRTWMAENLDYDAEWSMCYENKADSCKKYGRLYEWAIALKSCPAGWHLPSRWEWHNLITTVGAARAGIKLKSKSYWENIDGSHGTDDHGFLALPSGFCRTGEWSVDFVNGCAFWWTATENSTQFAYFRYMDNYGSRVNEDSGFKDNRYSVRCVANY